MKTHELQGQWKQIKGIVREKWGELTDDPAERATGRQERMAGVLQAHHGETTRQWQRTVDDYFRGLH